MKKSSPILCECIYVQNLFKFTAHWCACIRYYKIACIQLIKLDEQLNAGMSGHECGGILVQLCELAIINWMWIADNCVKSSFQTYVKHQSKNLSCNADAKFGDDALEKSSS